MRQEPIAAIIFKTKNLVSLFQLLPNPTALYKNVFFFFTFTTLCYSNNSKLHLICKPIFSEFIKFQTVSHCEILITLGMILPIDKLWITSFNLF